MCKVISVTSAWKNFCVEGYLIEVEVLASWKDLNVKYTEYCSYLKYCYNFIPLWELG